MKNKRKAIVLILVVTILFFPHYPVGADDAAPVDEGADLMTIKRMKTITPNAMVAVVCGLTILI